MLTGLRRKHLMLGTLSLTGVLVLLVFVGKPLPQNLTNPSPFTDQLQPAYIDQSVNIPNVKESEAKPVEVNIQSIESNKDDIVLVNDIPVADVKKESTHTVSVSKQTKTYPTNTKSQIRRKGRPFMKPSDKIPNSPRLSLKDVISQTEKIVQFRLKKEFAKVKRDFDFTPGNFVPDNVRKKVLIVSSWRSGSTFLGDIFDSYPGTFYSFEPLHKWLKNVHLEEGPLVPVIHKILRDIWTCNFGDQRDYLYYMRNITFLLEQNTRLWSACSRNRAVCFTALYNSNVCKMMPLNVMKTVRLGLSPVDDILRDQELNVQVIHLVRDPRGSLHSRKRLEWCTSKTCSDPETVCKDLLLDLTISDYLQKQYPTRFLPIRYEDLSLQTEETTKHILSFLGLSYTESVAKFVKEHTSLTYAKKKVSTYNTFRDSRATTFAWRNGMTFPEVEEIQSYCKSSLNKLNLTIFETEEQYRNMNISVLTNELILT